MEAAQSAEWGHGGEQPFAYMVSGLQQGLALYTRQGVLGEES